MATPTPTSNLAGKPSGGPPRHFRFHITQTVIVAIWIGVNAAGATRFDVYPFILLNLAFSLQAAYAAPLILLAQNRQADRDRVQYEQDRARAERNIADTDSLTRELRVFVPVVPGTAGIYIWGLTTQAPPHLGHVPSSNAT